VKNKLTLSTIVLIPSGVSNAAVRGLTLRHKYRRGGTSVGVATASTLASSLSISLAKVLHIANYFPRHAHDKLDQRNPPSNGYIAWLLWGGDPGRRWATKWKERHLKEQGRG
jgi:hypothetical protein